MKKLLKWTGFFVGALVLILIVAIIALPLILPLDKIKDIATAKISKSIHREVKIAKVSFNIFSGIKLEKLYISNKSGEITKQPFVAADSINLRYAFWPLFKRQVIIKEVSLVKPEIFVEKNSAGRFNFSDMTKQKAKTDKKKEEEKDSLDKAQGKQEQDLDKKDFSIFVDTFSIKEGKVTLVDQAAGTRSEVKKANLKISGITLALLKPIDLDFSAQAIYQNKTIPLALSGKIGLDLNKEKLSLPALNLKIAREKATISSTITRWKSGPEVDVAISSNQLSLDPLLAIFAAGTTKKKVKAKPGELTKTVNKATAAISPKYKINARININNLSLQKFKIAKVDLVASLARKQLSLKVNAIKAFEGTLSGQANINLAASGLAYRLKNFKLKNLNATPFTNAMVETFLTKMPDYKEMIDKVYGTLNLELSLAGQGVEPQEMLANAEGRGSFSLAGGEIKRMKTLAELGKLLKSNSLQNDMKLKDLAANFAIKDRVVSTKNLKLEDDKIKVNFTGGANLGTMVWAPGNRLALRAAPSISQGLPQEFALFRDKSGWLEMTFELTGSLKRPIPVPVLDKPVEKIIDKFKIKVETKKVEVEKQLEEEKKRAEEEAKKKLEEEAKKQLKDLINF